MRSLSHLLKCNFSSRRLELQICCEIRHDTIQAGKCAYSLMAIVEANKKKCLSEETFFDTTSTTTWKQLMLNRTQSSWYVLPIFRLLVLKGGKNDSFYAPTLSLWNCGKCLDINTSHCFTMHGAFAPSPAAFHSHFEFHNVHKIFVIYS